MALRENGPLPAELADVVICEAMGWSYRELMEAPAAFVEDVVTYLRTRALIAEERRIAAERAR